MRAQGHYVRCASASQLTIFVMSNFQKKVLAYASKNARAFSNVKPYEAIPGPPGKGWPFIGHMHHIIKKPAGIQKSWINLEDIVRKFLSKEDKILRVQSPVFNPKNGNLVVLLDSKDAEYVYRHEGKYPSRGPAFLPFHMIRKDRKDVFHESTGVLMEEGARWHDIRSKVQQDLMRPQSAYFYMTEIQGIADEFMDLIRKQRSPTDKVLKNALPEIYRYTFESISFIALDTRLGCLETPMDAEIVKLFEATKQFLGSFADLTVNPSWKFLPPRWNKAYRQAQDNFDILIDFMKVPVDAAVKKIKDNPTDDLNKMSVLEKMIKRNGFESSYPLVMAIDLTLAGIDTTGNSLGVLMYHLAANPDKQEILRKECQNVGKALTPKNMNELRYLKACLQETFRLTPIVPSMLRQIPEDMTIQGYNIPKDTLVMWSFHLLAKQFPDHDQFIPERWIENKKDICPFKVRQFSHGPRMCIGKRFAEMELLVVAHKLMHNFELKWMNPEPVSMSQKFINVPDQSLDFQFKDI